MSYNYNKIEGGELVIACTRRYILIPHRVDGSAYIHTLILKRFYFNLFVTDLYFTLLPNSQILKYLYP